MRIFAALYAVTALLLGLVRHDHHAPTPWLAVCVAATALGLAAAAKKPLVLLCAAHAGLTATWAGTLAARHFRPSDYAPPSPAMLAMLMMMCAGMAVLIANGLKSAPRAAEQTSPRR